MSNNKKAAVDTETILMTLDQLGQTIDIMTSVVDRLHNYVAQHHREPYPSPSLKKNIPLKDIEKSLKPISTTLH
jgi:hypothetical protein